MSKAGRIVSLSGDNRSFDEVETEMQEQPAQGIDLSYLYTVLRMNLRLILGVTVGCVVGMFIYLTFFATPVYSAFSQVLLDSRQAQVAPAEEVMSNLDLSSAVIAGEVVALQSNVLLGQVVDNLNLLDTPEFDPTSPKPESLLSKLKRLLRGQDPPHVQAMALSPETRHAMAVEKLRQNVGVQQLGVAYAIGISFESTDPRLAADVTNAIADGYIDSQLNEKLFASLRANAWLSDRLEELSVQVQESDAAIVEFRADMIERAGGNEDNIAQLLGELNTRLVSSSTDTADAEVRLSQVEALQAAGGLAAVSDVVTSPLLATLQQQRAQLAATQAQLGSTLGAKHPDMVRIAAEIADIDRSLEVELNRRIEEMRSDVVVTRNREEALNGQISIVSDRAYALARDSVRLGQLERTADATRLVYENFLARFKETSAQADFQTPEARVIGRAEVPSSPSSPRKSLLMIAAFALGLSGAVAFVFLKNLLRAPVLDADELRNLTGRPMLAALPKVTGIGRRFAWLQREMIGQSSSLYMEQVTNIRTAIFGGTGRKKTKVILVTSSVPNEGKTSLSCSLAKVLAKGGKSVLLMDADLRRPDVRDALKMPEKDACLIDYLEGKAKLQDVTLHSGLAGVDVISPSRRTAQAADLLMVPQFKGMMTRVSSAYDVIVINAPPILHMSDAVLLAEKSDVVIFSVHCGSTPSRVVRSSLNRLATSGITVTGTVLTMVQKVHAAGREMYSYDY